MSIAYKFRDEQIEHPSPFDKDGANIITLAIGDNIITDGISGGFIGNLDDSANSAFNILVNTSGLTVEHIDYDPAFPGDATVSSGVAWQSFTPTADIWCPGIAPSIKLSGQVGTLWIYEGEGVGGTLLLTMTGVSMPTPNTFNDITFPRMLFFENGQKYTWAWERDSGGYSFEQKDGYAGGVNNTGIDYLFKIYEATIKGIRVDLTTGDIHVTGGINVSGEATIGGGTDGYTDVKDSSDVSQAKLNSVGDGYHMQNFGIGTKTPNTKLDIQGGQTGNVTTVNAATYDLLVTDYILNVTYTATGAVTINLPSAQSVSGRLIHIKDAAGNAGINNITINAQGGTSIEGAPTVVLNSNYNSVSIYPDGINWFIF